VQFVIREMGRIARLALMAGLVAMAAIAVVAQDSHPARAVNTRIVISASPLGPSPEVSMLLFLPGDAPVQLYVWAADVTDPHGVGDYGVEFRYQPWLTGIQDFTIPSSNWIASTGRSATCVPNPPAILPDWQPGIGRAYFGCSTIGGAPPDGPQGNGYLSSFKVYPGASTPQNPIINVTTMTNLSYLQNPGLTAGNIPPADIPATKQDITVTLTRCADFTGTNGPDGTINIFDILYEATKFGLNTSSPSWNPVYDMDANGYVTIFDILIVGREFGRNCTAA